jgi:trehalose/maltose hydrolase-like predicted phosphorylase
MLFFNLSENAVSEMLTRLDYKHPDNLLSMNLHYYLQRTSHGSTLSRLVHGHLAHLAGMYELSWKLYQEALRSDYLDIQGGTTKEGIHLGVMTGTIVLAYRAYAGLDWNEEHLSLSPSLPAGWREMSFNVLFRGVTYFFVISHDQLRVKIEGAKKRSVTVNSEAIPLSQSKWITIDL